MDDDEFFDKITGDLFDRDGTPISLRQYLDLRRKGEAYIRIALTNIGESIQVSTVWLGMDHSFGMGGPPLIFETMAFIDGEGDQIVDRYPTSAAALAGHDQAVKRLKDAMASLLPDKDGQILGDDPGGRSTQG